MKRLEVADIVRRFGRSFRRTHWPTAEQRAALIAIERCRTAALGGHLEVCRECGFEEPRYNSCRNRHCPKCQSLAQAKWIAQRLERMLDVPSFHIVFTLPAELRVLAKLNRVQIFGLLFFAASETLLSLGRDPKRLGAELGITMVLHTWSRDLGFHPHVHAIVTGGGLSLDGTQWVDAKRGYLFPVQVMGALFRGKFLASLDRLCKRGELRLPDGLDVARLRDALYRKNWIVYAKRPFGGAAHVFRYLGRYTHRVGISNQRLLAITDTHVTFRTKEGKTVTVTGEEFLHRWVQHVLPRAFVKIRHYGLMASSNVETKLARARACIAYARESAPSTRTSESLPTDWKAWMHALTGVEVERCPRCDARAIVRIPLPLPRAPPVAA